MIARPFNHHESISDIVEHFTPNWFAMSMGTGISAICLNTLQTWLPAVHGVATIMWILNIVIFTLMTVTLVARTILYPQSWGRMLKHSSQPMFLGCIPMGLATIINGFIFFGVNLFGNISIDIAIFLWWVDVLMSMLCIIVVPYYMFYHHDNSLHNMTATWLLPFVACEVAAVSGAILLPYMSASMTVTVFTINIILWASSVSLAMGILVILFQRLALHKLPPVELASTIWLPLGPMGTGALAMFLFGGNIDKINMANLTEHYVYLMQIFHGMSIFIGIVLWTVGSWWLIIAVLVTFTYMRKQIMTFNLGFWGYTFPLGVYTMATVTFAKYSHLLGLTIYGVFLVVVLLLIWLMVFMRTMVGAYHGYLIKDPTIVYAK